MSEKGERRQQLEAAAETMNAMAADVEGLGSGIQTLVGEASEISGRIQTLTARLSSASASESMAICLELSTAVRSRAEIASKAAGLNMKCSQIGNRLRSEAKQVRPMRLVETIGKKLFAT